MGSRSFRRLPVATIAVLALVIGSFGFVGTSYAAGLTTKQVKKIAAKVVKKKAPKLSVAYAANAGNAVNANAVGGSSAADLKTKGYKYTMPTQAMLSSRDYSFPGLPPGTYLASYAYTANTSVAGADIGCSFDNLGGSTLIGAPSYSSDTGGTFARGSATAIITTTPTTILDCAAFAATFAMNSFNENTVSFVPIDSPVAAPATGARATAGRSPSGG